MKRVDMMTVQRIASSGVQWRLDPHTAKYAGLIHKDIPYVEYTITQDVSGRPDLIALRVYGDPSWWWVIATFNGIINPILEMVTGRRLYIPNYAAIDKLFKDQGAVDKAGQFLEV